MVCCGKYRLEGIVILQKYSVQYLKFNFQERRQANVILCNRASSHQLNKSVTQSG